MWPEYKGRDGCRTPMPWDSSAADLGFGSGKARPWLPFAQNHRALAIDRQRDDPASLLNHYRHLLHWRKSRPALIHGEIELLNEHPQVLAYVRRLADDRVVCAFNLSDRPCAFELPSDLEGARVLEDSGVRGAVLRRATVQFDAYGVLFARLA
jgi:alpha-glucosidase